MPVANPTIIYHYTTGDGLLGITQDSVLYATDVLYMNDSQEAKYPMSVVKKIIDGIAADDSMYPEPLQRSCIVAMTDFARLLFEMHDKRPTCATCFCTSGDLLSQWRAYGSAGGFAIGFDRAALDEMAPGRLAAIDYDWISQSVRIAALVKRTMESEDLEDEVVTQLAMECITNIWFNALYFKDGAFSEEQEWRLVSSADDSELEFRMSKVGLTPYLRLELPHGPDSPIREIVVGPCQHPSETERAVRLLLLRFGLSDVSVESSKVSLRL
jgi:hypothetical protein